MIDRPSPSDGSPLLLLGMHRSGTSALSRLLAASGVRIGISEELLPPHEQDNPHGYWERTDVLLAHDRYLAAIGCTWDRVSSLPSQPGGGSAGLRLQGELRQVIAGLAGPGPWLIKDPRLCLLLPVWQRLLPRAIAIVAVRHPLEIAASLSRSHRGVYPTAFIVSLWEKYLIRALTALHGQDVLFVDFRRYLADPEAQVIRLGSCLNCMGVQGLHLPDRDGIRGLVDRGLHRNFVEHGFVGDLNRQQIELTQWLEQAASAEGAVRVDHAGWIEPDAALGEFEASFDARILAGEQLERNRYNESLQKLHGVLECVREQLDRTREEHTASLELLAIEHGRLREDNLRLEQEVRKASVEAGRRQAELNQIHERARRMDQHAAGLDQAIIAIKQSWSWRLSAPLRLLGRLRLFPGRSEQWLYRMYYRMPGFSSARKRALVEWLHNHLPWLTRRTVSFQLYKAAKRLPERGRGGDWLERLDEIEAERRLAALTRRPVVSILMPVFNTNPDWLAAAVESVCTQRYPDWQLCIADDASDRKETVAWLAGLSDSRIKQVRLPRNVGIAMASDAALAIADGDFIAFLDHDDLLAPDALLEVVRRLESTGADFIYTDEDKIDFDGDHVEPHFKPDYSPDYFRSSNYVCHLAVIRREIVHRAGGFRPGFDGAQDYDLFLRCVEIADRVEHLPKVLYHWRKHVGSTSAASEAKHQSWDAGRRALAEALERQSIDAHVEPGRFPNTYRVRYRLRQEPLLSVIIPFRDQPDLLRDCVESVLSKGGYSNIEILAVDNGSAEYKTQEFLKQLQKRDRRIRVLRYDRPFNYSAINNWAVRRANGQQLLLLNNDVEAISQDWIRSMLEHAERREVGVVGARLLYPDDTVQHAGVLIGLGGVAGHSHLWRPRHHPGYFARAQLTQNLSAVTFACAMLRKEVFDELGGLNEVELAIAFNDVDFCLRAREQGYLVVYTPYAELYHHESKSRGGENTSEKLHRFNSEIAYMQRRHREVLASGDPYYNPNLSLHAHRSFEIEVRR